MGLPVAGMNATVRTFVRHCLHKNITVCAIQDGFEGLLKGNTKVMKWGDVNGWQNEGGAFLGTSTYIPKDYKKIAECLKQHKIQGLMFVGGFESYEAAINLTERRSEFKEFCIPMVVFPCSISNNIPGTEFSLGCDTALNEIIDICNNIHSGIQGEKQNVDVFETTGGYCGYLTTMTSVGIGADVSYIYEEKLGIKELLTDINTMRQKCTKEGVTGVVVTSERASENYNTDFIYRLYNEESANSFSVQMSRIGAMQEAFSGPPSPFDRKLGTISTVKAVDWFEATLKKYTKKDGSVLTDNNNTTVVLGLIRQEYKFTPVMKLKKLTDFEKRTSKVKWWLLMRPLLKILSFYETSEEEILID